MEGVFGEDDWLAVDKLYHVLFCFFISVSVAALCYRTPHPFLRRWSVSIGSLASLTAGAAKEAGDQIGLWSSSGASLSLFSIRRVFRSKVAGDPVPRISMV